MTANNPSKAEAAKWVKPVLERIGTISDVAGRPVPVDQDAGNRKS